MKQSRKIVVVFLGLLAAGAIKAPVELSLNRELRADQLLPEPLDLDVKEKIGQTGFAVALGGLRTLVATFYNLRGYTAFTEQRWMDAEESFETTVALAPSTIYYWTNGAWHMAYNASHYYQENEDLPPLRQQELWRASVLKGRSFLERGIRNNPHDWNLKAELGRLLTDSNKTSAFVGPGASTYPEIYELAAEAYHAASENGGPAYTLRNWFYNLARIPGKEADALALGEKLSQTRASRTPTLLALLFVLQMHQNPQQDPEALISQLFNDDARAYRALSFLWEDRKEHYPVDGLAGILKSLEQRLHIPLEKSVFHQK